METPGAERGGAGEEQRNPLYYRMMREFHPELQAEDDLFEFFEESLPTEQAGGVQSTASTQPEHPGLLQMQPFVEPNQDPLGAHRQSPKRGLPSLVIPYLFSRRHMPFIFSGNKEFDN